MIYDIQLKSLKTAIKLLSLYQRRPRRPPALRKKLYFLSSVAPTRLRGRLLLKRRFAPCFYKKPYLQGIKCAFSVIFSEKKPIKPQKTPPLCKRRTLTALKCFLFGFPHCPKAGTATVIPMSGIRRTAAPAFHSRCGSAPDFSLNGRYRRIFHWRQINSPAPPFPSQGRQYPPPAPPSAA